MFTTPLPPIRPLPHDDGECYELTEPLRWVNPDGTVDEVERGYVTDLASVPRVARTLCPTSGLHTPAAIRHDRRCDDLNAGTATMTSREADREFRDGIRQLDQRRPLRAWAMWAGVRWGALANGARRGGWHHDAALVLLVSALIAPLYGAVIAVNGIALLVDETLNRLACLVARPCRPVPARDVLADPPALAVAA